MGNFSTSLPQSQPPCPRAGIRVTVRGSEEPAASHGQARAHLPLSRQGCQVSTKNMGFRARDPPSNLSFGLCSKGVTPPSPRSGDTAGHHHLALAPPLFAVASLCGLYFLHCKMVLVPKKEEKRFIPYLEFS